MLDSAIASAHLVLSGDLHSSSGLSRLPRDEAAAEPGDRGGWWGRSSLSACCRACLTRGQPAEQRGYSAATFFLGVTGVSFLEELQLAHLCNEHVQVWAVCDVLTRNLKHWGGLGPMSLDGSARCLPESFVQPSPPLPSPTQPQALLTWYTYWNLQLQNGSQSGYTHKNLLNSWVFARIKHLDSFVPHIPL